MAYICSLASGSSGNALVLSCGSTHILLDAGLVNARKDGKWIYYSLSEEGARGAQQMLCSILNMK